MAVAETRNAPATTETETEKGASLARGPALILGTILLAAGLYSLYKQHTFPPFSNFPNGHAPIGGKVLGVFGANGWTGMLTAVAGGLLLFGAAQHLVAKTMSLVVGVALGAAAVIALISGDVLGMAAANHLTELAWGIAAAILLVNTLVPRRRRTVATGEPVAAREPVATREPGAAREPVATREPGAAREPVATREPGAAREPVATREPVAAREPVATREPGAAREPGADRAAPAEGDTSVTHDRDVTGEGTAPAEQDTHVMRDGADTRATPEREEAPTQRP